jgi:hypothetical protein
MAGFDRLVRDIQPCSVGGSCRNSPENAGLPRSKCSTCRLSPGNEDLPQQHWSPKDGSKHPELLKEKRSLRISKNQARIDERRSKDRGRQRVLKKATRAEKQSERNIIKATKNSGRSHKDGDHVSIGHITLDTKLQSQRDNPIVLLSELEKVRRDATRAGNTIGGLVLRNKHGVGVVVLHEDDYAKLTAEITHDSRESEPRSGQGPDQELPGPVPGT